MIQSRGVVPVPNISHESSVISASDIRIMRIFLMFFQERESVVKSRVSNTTKPPSHSCSTSAADAMKCASVNRSFVRGSSRWKKVFLSRYRYLLIQLPPYQMMEPSRT